MSNAELGTFCLNPRARVSELRKRGHLIECYNRDFYTGESWYRLVPAEAV